MISEILGDEDSSMPYYRKERFLHNTHSCRLPMVRMYHFPMATKQIYGSVGEPLGQPDLTELFLTPVPGV